MASDYCVTACGPDVGSGYIADGQLGTAADVHSLCRVAVRREVRLRCSLVAAEVRQERLSSKFRVQNVSFGELGKCGSLILPVIVSCPGH